jgi:hypothetical protein
MIARSDRRRRAPRLQHCWKLHLPMREVKLPWADQEAGNGCQIAIL